MKYKVFLHEMSILLNVGMYNSEKLAKQEVIISVELEVETIFQNDTLEHVYNYENLKKIVESVGNSKHFDMLETLGKEISVAFFQDKRVKKVHVNMYKTLLSVGVSNVGVDLEFMR